MSVRVAGTEIKSWGRELSLFSLFGGSVQAASAMMQ